MENKDKNQLTAEIAHIFESGANEIRIYEMVVAFIEKRYTANTSEIPNSSVKKPSDKYTLLVFYVQSCLIAVRKDLIVTPATTVENFQDDKKNAGICQGIFKSALDQYNYELSHNQMCNGINLFLKAFPLSTNQIDWDSFKKEIVRFHKNFFYTHKRIADNADFDYWLQSRPEFTPLPAHREVDVEINFARWICKKGYIGNRNGGWFKSEDKAPSKTTEDLYNDYLYDRIK